MMVETILESSSDFGMSGSALPQWKREVLQRRAARARAVPAPAPPPPPASLEDEELRYGPGIVKRLKSRYLSLALRDAPRRRPSVLRRAASLEHLLDERPPPAPRPAARAPRPASLAAPAPVHAPQPRRDFVKRARSVDALSRLEAREEPPPSPPPPPPPRPPPACRPPRRPTPLLRDTERPPPDLVRSTLRKFEPAPVRRAAPAARVSAALRGLERGAAGSPVAPEPRGRSPSPAGGAEVRPVDEPEGSAVSTPRAVSRAALEGIARAGSSTRYSFEAPRAGSHLPPLAATNAVLVGRARRVGVIRPMPSPALERAVSAALPAAEEIVEKTSVEPCAPEPKLAEEECPRPASPAPARPEPEPPRPEKRSPPPSALVEPIPRSPPEEPPPPLPRSPPPPQRELTPEPITTKPDLIIPKPEPAPLVNGHSESTTEVKKELVVEEKTKEAESTERSWNGVTLKRAGAAPAARRGGPRPGPAAASSVVFNFSHRAHVPDYIENDGLILRANRRDRLKAGEPGVVLLAGARAAEGDSSDGEGEEAEAGPPSPCDVRFVNDNVLINGRSSMPARRDRDRSARLKLQFDDSLTRTFEYPSETSLCEEEERPASPAPAQPPQPSALGVNTHLVSATLARYTPSKTSADVFQLGVTRHAPPPPVAVPESVPDGAGGVGGVGGVGEACEEARQCGADVTRAWSDARARTTDLLF